MINGKCFDRGNEDRSNAFRKWFSRAKVTRLVAYRVNNSTSEATHRTPTCSFFEKTKNQYTSIVDTRLTRATCDRHRVRRVTYSCYRRAFLRRRDRGICIKTGRGDDNNMHITRQMRPTNGRRILVPAKTVRHSQGPRNNISVLRWRRRATVRSGVGCDDKWTVFTRIACLRVRADRFVALKTAANV